MKKPDALPSILQCMEVPADQSSNLNSSNDHTANNGHRSARLSKYDAHVTRMGMIGRQKRALKVQLNPSPSTTPSTTPALAVDLGQPFYFSLSRETSHSREHSRRTSGNRSDSADSDALQAMFRC